MLTTVASNLLDFILSVPINLVIIGIVCLILKICGKTVKTIIRVIIGYFAICLVLSLLGFSPFSIPAVIVWVKNVTVELGAWFRGLGIL